MSDDVRSYLPIQVVGFSFCSTSAINISIAGELQIKKASDRINALQYVVPTDCAAGDPVG